VAIAVTTEDGRHLRLIAATSLIGDLIAYLSRARTRAVERLEATGIKHQVTTSLDAGAVTDPKSITLAVARDKSQAMLQVTDTQGGTVNIRLTPELTASLATQLARASTDMKA
jgi:hypothetical protein